MPSKTEYIAYFKILWARRSAITLYQAACLSCGRHPEGFKDEISVTATNMVSKRYHWLKSKSASYQVLEQKNGQDYYNGGTLFRDLRESFVVDEDFLTAFDHMYDAGSGIPSKKVSKSVYREFGRIIYELYPEATRKQVADILVDLPSYYNDGVYGEVESLQSESISSYLKGLGDLTQKPAEEDKPKINIDLSEIVEITKQFPESEKGPFSH